MIKATELRRGNYINDIALGTCEVVAIFTNSIEVCKINQPNVSYCISNIEPIPLTEEWLVKLGFKLNYTSPRKCYVYKLNNLYVEVYIYKNGRVDLEITKTILNAPKYRCLYFKELTVSKLQNLTYFVTNEELTLHN